MLALGSAEKKSSIVVGREEREGRRGRDGGGGRGGEGGGKRDKPSIDRKKEKRGRLSLKVLQSLHERRAVPSVSLSKSRERRCVLVVDNVQGN